LLDTTGYKSYDFGNGRMLVKRQGNMYSEKLQSTKTEILFILLMLLFFGLFIWHIYSTNYNAWRIVFICFSLFFLFYAINYRTLLVHLTNERLQLRFGIFTWTVPLDNIEDCRLDDISAPMRFGGAGIHFMLINRRYRVSFNFLEYPRVVIALKTKQGPVRDVSFTTQQPEEIIRRINQMSNTNEE